MGVANAFQAVVNSSPARARIVRTGYLDDATLGDVLRGAAVLAYPSLYEGFGFPPVQAMAEGVPVVSTRVGAIPEVVGDGAALVEPGDPEALAAALDAALAGGDELTAQVDRGRRRAEAFTWSACAAGLVGLYLDAAGAGPVSPGPGSSCSWSNSGAGPPGGSVPTCGA